MPRNMRIICSNDALSCKNVLERTDNNNNDIPIILIMLIVILTIIHKSLFNAQLNNKLNGPQNIKFLRPGNV